jgi:NADH:ubiquinone oxidoreductase subunit 6 (subunit J)
MLALLAAAAEPEPSKTWFYIAGAVLVLWAFVLFLYGMRESKWPDRISGERLVIGISALLVAATMTAAVATS